jgi:hypothetical protein
MFVFEVMAENSTLRVRHLTPPPQFQVAIIQNNTSEQMYAIGCVYYDSFLSSHINLLSCDMKIRVLSSFQISGKKKNGCKLKKMRNN